MFQVDINDDIWKRTEGVGMRQILLEFNNNTHLQLISTYIFRQKKNIHVQNYIPTHPITGYDSIY